MKKIKVLLASLLCAGLMLAGCTKEGQSSGTNTSEPATSEVVPSEPSEPSEPEVEGMTPEEAITDIASYWGGSVTEVETGVFGTMGIFPAANYSVDDMKGFVSSMFVPEEFKLANDWAVDEDGTNSCVYTNAVLTVLAFYVYADTVYVKDGKIVEEGTEGATATDVTCIEVYGYTYSE